ncbi:MAG TPA: metallophosphoesterase family protein [Myxococcota bacterium]|nr:metallophosphoesterase family protein [Myxococcota bacterium]HRY96282.1 metallophosphoesterase family protein [Myxococcota bacterium]HSA22935.1 metallophosphoesterase family protein [Myxococcota bacterium]
MRLGIFSDVHSNLEALEAVVRAYQDLQIDKYICLGDVVGYGASPNECCEIVRKLASVVVLGNHDAAVCGRMEYSYYYDAARHALDWCVAKLSPQHHAWLRGLPFVERWQEQELSFSHGNPLYPEAFEYIFTLEQAAELLPSFEAMAAVSFIGHSHLTKSYALHPGEVNEVVARRFGLRRHCKYVITDGSVGQPRDYDNRACFTVFDTEARVLQYHRVEYDVEQAAKKIFDAKLAVNFGKRLFLGV